MNLKGYIVIKMDSLLQKQILQIYFFVRVSLGLDLDSMRYIYIWIWTAGNIVFVWALTLTPDSIYAFYIVSCFPFVSVVSQ